MTIENLAKSIIDIWNEKDLTKLQGVYGTDIPFFDPLLGRAIKGDEIIEYAKGIYEAFPDLVFKVESIATGKDVAMVQWVQCGKNTGPILGKAPTQRYIEIPAVSVITTKEGKLESHRDYWDMKKLANDLFK